ncbi:MAG: OmpA family protein [Paracoccaceae bacterium]
MRTARISQPNGSTDVPVAAFSNGQVPSVVAQGSIRQEAWSFTEGNISTMQIMAALREQLMAENFEIILDCDTDICGGFDFRFEIDLLPEPEMHVDLGDFRFLSASRTETGDQTEYVSLVVSRSANTGFVQMTRISRPEDQDPVIVASSKSTEPELIAPLDPPLVGPLATQLAQTGRASLEGLSFKTGSSSLGDEKFAALQALADYLKRNPNRTVALVGHTDAEGSLAINLKLSRKRAASVLERLVSGYGVPRDQLEAAGVGYLVPRASNLTQEGRTQNRRVEVIVTSTR